MPANDAEKRARAFALTRAFIADWAPRETRLLDALRERFLEGLPDEGRAAGANEFGLEFGVGVVWGVTIFWALCREYGVDLRRKREPEPRELEMILQLISDRQVAQLPPPRGLLQSGAERALIEVFPDLATALEACRSVGLSPAVPQGDDLERFWRQVLTDLLETRQVRRLHGIATLAAAIKPEDRRLSAWLRILDSTEE